MWFFKPTGVYNPDHISISSSVVASLTNVSRLTDRQTDRQRDHATQHAASRTTDQRPVLQRGKFISADCVPRKCCHYSLLLIIAFSA